MKAARAGAIVATALVACGGAGATRAVAGCAPEPMLKVVYRDITPGVAAGTFLEKPKTLYRLGNKYGRSEEEADLKEGIHALIVVSEPDVWMINLLKKTGEHIVDAGPTYDFHAPIAPLEKGPAVIAELEFGCELAFFASHGKPAGRATVEGKTYERSVLKVDAWRLEMLYDPQAKAPFEVSIFEGKKPLEVLRYDVYRSDLQPDLGLFRRPEGIDYREPKETTPGA